MVRDLDVAIERVVAESGDELAVIAELQHWDDKRAESHRLLARALQSARYRRLVEQTSAWIESGPGRPGAARKPFDCAAARSPTTRRQRLTEWEKTLLKKARKLEQARRRETAQAAASQQAADLFDRIARRICSSTDAAGETEVHPQAIAQGAAVARTIERRCARASLGSVVERGRPRKPAFASATASGKRSCCEGPQRPTGSWTRAKPFRSSDLAPNSEPED